MMMLDYKGGRGGQESGKKWSRNEWMLLTTKFINFYQSNLYFFYLNFLDFLWYLCWVLNFKFIKSLLSNTCGLFLRMFEVFNEMEMEINVINNKINKIFTKLYLQIRVRGKEILEYVIF